MTIEYAKEKKKNNTNMFNQANKIIFSFLSENITNSKRLNFFKKKIN